MFFNKEDKHLTSLVMKEKSTPLSHAQALFCLQRLDIITVKHLSFQLATKIKVTDPQKKS